MVGTAEQEATFGEKAPRSASQRSCYLPALFVAQGDDGVDARGAHGGDGAGGDGY